MVKIKGNRWNWVLFFVGKFVVIFSGMESISDSDRLQRLRELEAQLRDPRGVINVDSLLVSHWTMRKKIQRLCAAHNLDSGSGDFRLTLNMYSHHCFSFLSLTCGPKMQECFTIGWLQSVCMFSLHVTIKHAVLCLPWKIRRWEPPLLSLLLAESDLLLHYV